MDKELVLRDLAALVAIPSRTEDPAQARKALDWLLCRAAAFGLHTGVTPEGDAGWAELGAGDVTLGVLVHVDVVGPGDLAQWVTGPYELAARDGCLFGRGVEDDKGPAVLCLHAMKAVLDSGVPLRKRIRLVVGTSEELAWTDMAHYRRAFGSPDYGFSPDASFPIFNIETGYCDVRLRFDGSAFEALDAGDSPNTIPSRASLRLRGGEDVVCRGVSAHSSVPEQAKNAIVLLARQAPDTPVMRFILAMFDGDCHGVRLGLDDGRDTHESLFVGKTVCSPTLLRLEGGDAVLNVNIRYRVGLTQADLQAAFARHAADGGYTFELTDATDPLCVDPDLPFLRAMNETAEAHGLPSGFLFAQGSTYCGCMKNHVGWGPVIPPDEGSAHQENECVRLEDFWRAGAVYEDYLLRAAQTEA